MRASLHALTAELRRLKASGVKSLPVSDESLTILRAALSGRAAGSTPAVAAVTPEIPVEPVAYKTPTKTFVAKPAPVTASTIPAPTPFVLPAGDKATRWAALKERVLNDPVCRAQVR